MAEIARLLGFAFANADFLFEVDRGGKITAYIGASSPFSGDGDLNGRSAQKLFDPLDAVKFMAHMRSVTDGGRAGPLKLKLASGGAADVSFCHLPQNGERVCCTLTYPGVRQALNFGGDQKTGLTDRDSFLRTAAATNDTSKEMSFVNIPGLSEACAKLPAPQSDALLKTIGQAVKSVGAKAAARVGNSIFAVIGAAPIGELGLASTIRNALRQDGHDLPEVTETTVSLKSTDLSPEQRMLALRHTVGQAGDKSGKTKPGDDLTAIFGGMMTQTLTRAAEMTGTAGQSAYSFAYQPILKLKTGGRTHFEVLSRFNGDANTGDTAHLAAALGVPEVVNLTILAKVIHDAENAPQSRVAVNLPGRVFTQPMTFGAIAGLLARKRALAPRLLIEINEAAEIEDFLAANAAIKTVREMGYRVGLDDFGSGAASFQYLHVLDVDFVKFDSLLTGKLGVSSRDDTLLAGMVKLCSELDVRTIAQGIESKAQFTLARDMGINLGQGPYIAAPQAHMVSAPTSLPADMHEMPAGA
jgi:EAL domain-containing protein (putative c-di-GMP-specific phosphodiesterase class I)